MTIIVIILITIIGTLLASVPPRINFREIYRHLLQIFWPLIGAIAVGLSDTLSKHVINQTSSFSFVFALAIVQLPVALIYLKVERQKLKHIITSVKNSFIDYQYPILGSFLNIIGTGFLWLAFNYTLASIASPITASSGALIILFALLLLKEKVSPVNLVGVLITFAGVFGISFTLG